MGTATRVGFVDRVRVALGPDDDRPDGRVGQHELGTPKRMGKPRSVERMQMHAQAQFGNGDSLEHGLNRAPTWR